MGITSKNINLLYNRFMKFVELEAKELLGTEFGCENFLQSAEMWQRYQELGREAYLVGVVSKGSGAAGSGAAGSGAGRKVLAAGILTARNWHFGRKIFRVAGGWLMDYDAENTQEVLECLTAGAKEFCRKKGGMVLMVSPNVASRETLRQEFTGLGYKYLGEYEQVKWQYVLDLVNEDGSRRTAEGIFKNFRQNHRWMTRRAERDGIRVRELGEEELGILKTLTAEAGERHGFRAADEEYYRSMKRAFGEKAKFVVAEVEIDGRQVPLAAGMFIWSQREMVYLYSGSATGYEKYGKAYAVQWAMIQEAVRLGCQRYNFYGTRPVEGNGVYKFKQGFRGRVEELLGTFGLPLDMMGKIYLARIKPQKYGDVQ